MRRSSLLLCVVAAGGLVSACADEETAAHATTAAPESDGLSGEACYLDRLGLYEHLVVAELVSRESVRIVELQGYDPIPVAALRATQVLDSSPAAKGLAAGGDFEVSIYAADDLTNSVLGGAFEVADQRTMLLLHDYPGASDYQAYIVEETPEGLVFSADTCDDTGRMQQLAEQIGTGTSDLQLLTDLRHAKTDGSCSIMPCDQLLQNLMTLGAEQPISWFDLPPTERNINMREVPLEVLPELLVVGVHAEYSGTIPQGLFGFSCELGMSIGWATDAGAPLYPAYACRQSDLVLSLETDRGKSVVGTIPVETVLAGEEDGISITISGTDDGSVTLSDVRLMAPGEMEEVSGLSTETLEQLRAEYSGADRT